ncbi:MAG: TauD/TfdA family dioxygenase [Sneathiella sp.]|nr:TauD/TfdA family dioxygenase [Sneathiella sp.]
MEQGYLPYKEQTKHYFDRPHEELPEIPVASPAAWYGRDLRDQKSWIARLTDADIAEIEAALEVADKTAKETRDLLPTDFPLPTLSKKIAIWREEVRDGRGFQVVRGVPVQNWSQQKAERFFWCFGLHMGRPGGQNQSGDLLGHVRSLKKASEPDALSRLYMTASNIDYHCDGADVVGLLCLNKAKTGGRSRIVSSVTVLMN